MTTDALNRATVRARLLALAARYAAEGKHILAAIARQDAQQYA